MQEDGPPRGVLGRSRRARPCRSGTHPTCRLATAAAAAAPAAGWTFTLTRSPLPNHHANKHEVRAVDRLPSSPARIGSPYINPLARHRHGSNSPPPLDHHAQIDGLSDGGAPPPHPHARGGGGGRGGGGAVRAGDAADGAVHAVPRRRPRDDALRHLLRQPRRAQPDGPGPRRPRRRLQLRQGRRRRLPRRRLLPRLRPPRRLRPLHQLHHRPQHGLQPGYRGTENLRA
uniref:Uncharacterized protein n=1 Tax=Oryza glumipatula TaxID=40148 RepID=A0A0D9Y598_9ORYZ